MYEKDAEFQKETGDTIRDQNSEPHRVDIQACEGRIYD
jgi:hypothetical protein